MTNKSEGPMNLVNGELVPMTGDDLADYLDRLAAPASPAPRSILAGWFKAALSQMGHLAAVNAAVAEMPEWKRILWDAATSFREDDADLVAVSGLLNISLKAVFDRAEEIRATTRGGA